MWMGITTNGIGKIQMPTTTVSAKDSVEESKGASFADIMELSSQPKVDSKDSVVPDTINQKADNKVQPAEADKFDTTKDVKDTSKSETKSVDTVKKDEPVAKDIIKEAIEKIWNVLQDKLGVTEEDIEDALENLSFMLQDLLAPNNLKDFVLFVKGASEVDMLVSEQLSDLVSVIQTALMDVLDDFGITAEDIANYLEQLKANPENELEFAEETVEDTMDSSRTQTENDADSLINVTVDADIVNEAQTTETSNTKQDASEADQSAIAANLNQAIENALAPDQVEGINDYQSEAMQADIIRQVVEAVQVEMSNDHTSMVLQLNPEHLGKIQISIIQREGIMQAQIIAENEAAKHAIESNIALLQETFNNQELRVESVEVMVATYEFFNQQDAQGQAEERNMTQRGSGISSSLEGFEDVEEEETLEETIMRAQGNSVNYSI